MFKKPLKIKSNTRLKNSECKQIREELVHVYPQVKNDIDTIIPKKETLFCVRVLINDTTPVQIYVSQQRAIAFKANDILFPTVYLLWKFPDLMLNFTTNSFVCTKLVKGADLMLAGVFETDVFQKTFPTQTPACVSTNDNKAAIAVGVTGKSSAEMLKDRNNGKCVIIYHYYGDHLCSLENLPQLPFPNLGPIESPEVQHEEEVANGEEQEQECAGVNLNDNEVKDVEESGDDGENAGQAGDAENAEQGPEHSEEITTEQMDELLQKCFLASLKYSKTLKVPILTSTFYKLEMITSCPLGKSLDIKKSSYKKLGQFLKHMAKTGVITVKELKKGAESITAINEGHPLLQGFFLEKDLRPIKAEVEKPSTAAPSITESYIITPAVLPLFKGFGFQKGDQMQERDVRNHVTNYVKANNCQDAENRSMVKLQDPNLASIFKDKDAVSWEELMNKVCSMMKSCYKVHGAVKDVEAKGKIQPISMKVETRTGNKKVTIIDNIELFGISISEFAKECQHGVSASASISRPPGKKSDQLMVQGNQVLFVHHLLTDKYKIPVKYIKGLEFAPKKK